MTESRITFLCKAASLIPGANVNKTLQILKSHYMMRCKELSKGYGLPQKHFSEQVRCSHCCLEWGEGTQTSFRSIKLSKRQRKRIRSQKKLSSKVDKAHLLHSNELEQICTFCRHSTITVIPKSNKTTTIKSKTPSNDINITAKKIETNQDKKIKNKEICNVYSKTDQVFKLNNKKNILKNTIKEKPKIIKNKKKKKDKFAGLCQKAVLASAKLKPVNDKQNKLNLFLKPSS